MKGENPLTEKSAGFLLFASVTALFGLDAGHPLSTGYPFQSSIGFLISRIGDKAKGFDFREQVGETVIFSIGNASVRVYDNVKNRCRKARIF